MPLQLHDYPDTASARCRWRWPFRLPRFLPDAARLDPGWMPATARFGWRWDSGRARFLPEPACIDREWMPAPARFRWRRRSGRERCLSDRARLDRGRMPGPQTAGTSLGGELRLSSLRAADGSQAARTASVQRRRQRLAIWPALAALGECSRVWAREGGSQQLHPLVRRREVRPAPWRTSDPVAAARRRLRRPGRPLLHARTAALPARPWTAALHGQAEGWVCAVDAR